MLVAQLLSRLQRIERALGRVPTRPKGPRTIDIDILLYGDAIGEDEVVVIKGVPATTPSRTAIDLGCWYPRSEAVAAIDALARATDLKIPDVDVLAQRYPGRRGIRQARATLGLVDAGARSAKQTWLRLLLIQAGLPRPRTQIPVRDEFGDPSSPSLGRNQLHPGEHDGVLAGGRDDVGQQPTVFLPDGGM